MCTACTNPMCSRIFGSSTCGTKSSCKKQKTSDVNLRAASVVFMLPCVRGFNWRWLWSVVSGQSCKLTIKFGNKCSLCLLPTKMSCLVFALFRWWTLFFFLSFDVFWFLILWLLLHQYIESNKEDILLWRGENLAGWEFFSCFYWRWEPERSLIHE